MSIFNNLDRRPALVEIKDFEKSTSVQLLRDAFGQYLLYRAVLRYAHMAHVPLYLAIPGAAHRGVFNTPIGRLVVNEAQMNLVVFDPVQEVIEQWQPFTTSSEE